jgi:hypothetical protein
MIVLLSQRGIDTGQQRQCIVAGVKEETLFPEFLYIRMVPHSLSEYSVAAKFCKDDKIRVAGIGGKAVHSEAIQAGARSKEIISSLHPLSYPRILKAHRVK